MFRILDGQDRRNRANSHFRNSANPSELRHRRRNEENRLRRIGQADCARDIRRAREQERMRERHRKIRAMRDRKRGVPSRALPASMSSSLRLEQDHPFLFRAEEQMTDICSPRGDVDYGRILGQLSASLERLERSERGFGDDEVGPSISVGPLFALSSSPQFNFGAEHGVNGAYYQPDDECNLLGSVSMYEGRDEDEGVCVEDVQIVIEPVKEEGRNRPVRDVRSRSLALDMSTPDVSDNWGENTIHAVLMPISPSSSTFSRQPLSLSPIPFSTSPSRRLTYAEIAAIGLNRERERSGGVFPPPDVTRPPNVIDAGKFQAAPSPPPPEAATSKDTPAYIPFSEVLPFSTEESPEPDTTTPASPSISITIDPVPTPAPTEPEVIPTTIPDLMLTIDGVSSSIVVVPITDSDSERASEPDEEVDSDEQDVKVIDALVIASALGGEEDDWEIL
ncbi:hypothetical protein HDV00_007168 [Rhizophlyctis rosea]|nr:hypothetical protein HDV00_007168 [Rhizophlyctis rosea]